MMGICLGNIVYRLRGLCNAKSDVLSVYNISLV